MTDLTITSPANPRLKSLVALRRRGERDQTGLTLIEGYEELRLALAAGVRPQSVYYCPELMADPTAQRDVVDDAARVGAYVVQLGRTAFQKAAYREGPDGFLAVAPTISRGLDALRLPDDSLTLVCQGVEKPGNLGAMLRTADAAGVDALVAADPVTDWGNPNLVRASKGTVFAVPVASERTERVLEWLAARGVRLVATTPGATLDYTQVDYGGAVAIAVGAEKDGLDERMLGAAGVAIRIPMKGQVNSLNVATSAAIVIYEALRQRRGGYPAGA